MTKTIFTVYWMYDSIRPNALQFTDMNDALSFMEAKRKSSAEEKISAITMCSESTNMVGKMGVDSVVNGKTPDGHVYDWNKYSRVGMGRQTNYPSVGTDLVEVKMED